MKNIDYLKEEVRKKRKKFENDNVWNHVFNRINQNIEKIENDLDMINTAIEIKEIGVK